jgi:hypothetical protein
MLSGLIQNYRRGLTMLIPAPLELAIGLIIQREVS